MYTCTYAHTTVRGRERKIEVRVFLEISSRTRDEVRTTVLGKCLEKKIKITKKLCSLLVNGYCTFY